MNHSSQRIGQKLFLVFSMLSLAGCFKPDAPPSYEFEPLESPLSASHPQCPDLSGTYRLTPDSQESRLFSPYLLPPHQMDMVQLKRNSSDWFLYRLKMDKTRFVEQVSALRASNPQAYATWYALITQWRQEQHEKKDTSVLEAKILQIGPLPERGGLLTPTLCEAFWGQVKYQDGAPIGLDGNDEAANTVETVTRLSRSKQGALLFRYDNYRTTSFMFGSNIRTGIINSAYAKLEPVQHALFDWDVSYETVPRPGVGMEQSANLSVAQADIQPAGQFAKNVAERPANLPAVLVDVQQYAMGNLPAGGSITAFVLDKPSPQNTALWISMKGETSSNKEVSDLLRAMDQHAQVENVELVSVRQTPENKIEFEIRLKLRNQQAGTQ